MFYFVICLYVLLIFTQTTAVEKDNTCYNRFEYEYSVLEKLISLRLDNDNLTAIVEGLQCAVTTISQTLQGLMHIRKNEQGSGGTLYTRWGRSNCPNDTNAEIVYDGYAAGGHYTHSGSGSNYLCLPRDPIFGDEISDGHRGLLYGVEYEIPASFKSGLFNQDVPCAVCRVPETPVIMIPGRNQCYPDWKLEYSGYLVSQYYGHAGNKEFVCMDSDPDILNSGVADQNGALFYLIEGRCGSLKCPPYIEGREITCAVCSYAPSP